MKLEIEIRDELWRKIVLESYKEKLSIDDTIQLMLMMYVSPLTKHDEMDYRITKKLVKILREEKNER